MRSGLDLDEEMKVAALQRRLTATSERVQRKHKSIPATRSWGREPSQERQKGSFNRLFVRVWHTGVGLAVGPGDELHMGRVGGRDMIAPGEELIVEPGPVERGLYATETGGSNSVRTAKRASVPRRRCSRTTLPSESRMHSVR